MEDWMKFALVAILGPIAIALWVAWIMVVFTTAVWIAVRIWPREPR